MTDTMHTPAVVVSCDSHVGPLLRAQLRDYCPKQHLDEFDAFAAEHDATHGFTHTGEYDGAAFVAEHPNMAVAGHHDIAARLADMDRDGVAAEVIFHFSQNGEPLPFVANPAGGLGAVGPTDFGLGAVGYHIYNQWLADFVSTQPERHVGLAYLPTWDIDAAVRELEWARGAGLRAVNFPPPSRVGHVEYNHPAWEPFWSACEDLDAPLVTHSSGAAPFDYFGGPGGQDILIYECGGWMARRAVWWLIHGRVFERHPGLRLVITEQYEGWWTPTLAELDAVYYRFARPSSGDEMLPKPPSEYMRSNVFMGASFMSIALAEEAWREHYAGNVMWGRDYPHVEGTFQVRDDPTAEPITRLSLRNVLSHVPTAEALMMAGENAVRVFGLDRDKLLGVAAAIGAPAPAELATAPDALPDISPRSNAFRGQAGPRPSEVSLA
jgi:predicted TIM-barrel fold metal-dependent hydrolase